MLKTKAKTSTAAKPSRRDSAKIKIRATTAKSARVSSDDAWMSSAVDTIQQQVTKLERAWRTLESRSVNMANRLA